MAVDFLTLKALQKNMLRFLPHPHCQRVFSVAGIVVDKRCAALTPKTIDALVFLNKNSFMLGLNKECPTMPKPDLILKIDDESENEELVENLQQDSDVDEVLINLSESDDSEA